MSPRPLLVKFSFARNLRDFGTHLDGATTTAYLALAALLSRPALALFF